MKEYLIRFTNGYTTLIKSNSCLSAFKIARQEFKARFYNIPITKKMIQL